MTEKMPSSTRLGSRPIALRTCSYSSALRPCCSTISGVIWDMARPLSATVDSSQLVASVDPCAQHRHTARRDGTGAGIAALTCEEALRALEDVVRRLEGGEVPLDESIGLYERGEALRRHCQARLDAAQARIDKIVAGPDGRAASAVSFDAG